MPQIQKVNIMATVFKTTRKQAKESNTIVLAVPSCFLQHAMNYESRIAYNKGVNGWNFDLYQLNGTYSIVTGYRGHTQSSTHDINDYPELKTALRHFDNACVGSMMSKEDRKTKLIELLDYHLVM